MSAIALHDVASAGARRAELSDIFRRYGPAYLRTHRLTPNRHQAVRAIVNCRTAALGGHRDWCPQCGYEHYQYHSCRNRHCPKCQSLVTAAWVAARQQELLPVPYFHNVFTLPHELNRLILWNDYNRWALFGLLFRAAARTLQELGHHEQGGKMGFTMVLHTWDQQLRAHVHVHCLIASGALAADRSRWIAGGSEFLFPVRVLSKIFRGKYLAGLRQLLEQNELDLPSGCDQFTCPHRRKRWLRQLYKKPWVVYSKKPFCGPRKLLDYLARYTHRVAITNHRILSCDNRQVRFHYRDRQDGDRRKIATLDAQEFIDRFLLHVLPSGFMRVRHYGFLANCIKKECVAKCRQLLGVRPQACEVDSPQNVADWLRVVCDIDVTRCPRCGGTLRHQLLPELPSAYLRLYHPDDTNDTGSFHPWDTS